ncbi:MAG: ribosome maturation factor RimM [Candidatus Kapaibacterium sp.]
MADSSLIRLGILTRPHGVEGGMRCRLDQQSVPVVDTPCRVSIGYSISFVQPYELIKCEPGREGELVCYFRGIDNREETEPLSDKGIFVERKVLHYGEIWSDPGLIGSRILDESGKELGRLAGMFDSAAHYIWRIEQGEREWLLPAIEEFVIDVDEEEGVIQVRLIPGLYDDDAEEVSNG